MKKKKVLNTFVVLVFTIFLAIIVKIIVNFLKERTWQNFLQNAQRRNDPYTQGYAEGIKQGLSLCQRCHAALAPAERQQIEPPPTPIFFINSKVQLEPRSRVQFFNDHY